MSKSEHIEFQGRVTEVLPAGRFRVVLDNKHMLLAHLGGKLKINHIRVVLGDKVTIAMSPYDPTKGIIVYRA